MVNILFSNFFLAPLLQNKYKEKQQNNLLEEYDSYYTKINYPTIFRLLNVSNFKLISNYLLLYKQIKLCCI